MKTNYEIAQEIIDTPMDLVHIQGWGKAMPSPRMLAATLALVDAFDKVVVPETGDISKEDDVALEAALLVYYEAGGMAGKIALAERRMQKKT